MMQWIDTDGIGIVEHVVCDVDIRRSPSKLPSISGKHQDVKTGLPGSVQKRQSLPNRKGELGIDPKWLYTYDLIVMSHVKLIESWRLCIPAIRA